MASEDPERGTTQQDARDTYQQDEEEQDDYKDAAQSEQGSTHREDQETPDIDNIINTNEFVQDWMEDARERDAKDTDLWVDFGTDFEGWTLGMFKSLGSKAQLRKFLRVNGVWVMRDRVSPIGKALFELLQESEHSGWPEKDLKDMRESNSRYAVDAPTRPRAIDRQPSPTASAATATPPLTQGVAETFPKASPQPQQPIKKTESSTPTPGPSRSYDVLGTDTQHPAYPPSLPSSHKSETQGPGKNGLRRNLPWLASTPTTQLEA